MGTPLSPKWSRRRTSNYKFKSLYLNFVLNKYNLTLLLTIKQENNQVTFRKATSTSQLQCSQSALKESLRLPGYKRCWEVHISFVDCQNEQPWESQIQEVSGWLSSSSIHLFFLPSVNESLPFIELYCLYVDISAMYMSPPIIYPAETPLTLIQFFFLTVSYFIFQNYHTWHDTETWIAENDSYLLQSSANNAIIQLKYSSIGSSPSSLECHNETYIPNTHCLLFGK